MRFKDLKVGDWIICKKTFKYDKQHLKIIRIDKDKTIWFEGYLNISNREPINLGVANDYFSNKDYRKLTQRELNEVLEKQI